MEGQSTRLGGSIVGDAGYRHEAGHAGDGHHMTLVVFDHVGQERATCVPMRQKVDSKDLIQLLRCSLDDGMRGANAGIVDQNGWVADG